MKARGVLGDRVSPGGRHVCSAGLFKTDRSPRSVRITATACRHGYLAGETAPRAKSARTMDIFALVVSDDVAIFPAEPSSMQARSHQLLGPKVQQQHGTYYDINRRRLLFDTVLEVVDLNRNAVTHRGLIDAFLVGFIPATDVAYTYDEIDGVPKVTLYRIHF